MLKLKHNYIKHLKIRSRISNKKAPKEAILIRFKCVNMQEGVD